MKADNIRQLKAALQEEPHHRLVDICLRLARHKTENKELLTYLLFEADDEPGYVAALKSEADSMFGEAVRGHLYYQKKHLRKILRRLKLLIRYSGNKQTEADVLIHFCRRMTELPPSVRANPAMNHLYQRQLQSVHKAITSLHEDLRYDYLQELEELPASFI